MRYTPRHYASALLAALKGKTVPKQKEVIRRFLFLVRKRRASARLDLIVRAVERQTLTEAGLTKVEVTSAAQLTKEVKAEIERVLGRNLLWRESVNPEVLAGMKVLVDGELLVDATGKRGIERLFQ